MFYGDAFAADKVEAEVYGFDISNGIEIIITINNIINNINIIIRQ